MRPQEAYQAILSSMQPGWTLRLLQLFWPDPQPRLEYQKQILKWKMPVMEGLDILHQGLLLAVQKYPLPFVRRTVLELVLPGDEGIAWWQGLGGLCAGFGLKVCYLDQTNIAALTHWVHNSNLEYGRLSACTPRSKGGKFLQVFDVISKPFLNLEIALDKL